MPTDVQRFERYSSERAAQKGEVAGAIGRIAGWTDAARCRQETWYPRRNGTPLASSLPCASSGSAATRGLSHEQVPVLVARDRFGATADSVLKATDAVTMAAALKPFVSTDMVLCTDGSKVLGAAARALGVEHHAVHLSAGIRVDGAWHVQNVNAYHSRLKNWVRQFNGVATRYLENYIGWFRTLDRKSSNSLQPPQWLALAMGAQA